MIITTKSNEPDFWGEGEYYKIFINNKERLCFGSMESEDATLGRDLSCVYGIPTLLKEAFEAGKRGEDITIIEEND